MSTKTETTAVIVGCTFVHAGKACGEDAEYRGPWSESWCPGHLIGYVPPKLCTRCEEPRRWAAVIDHGDGTWEHVDCDATSKDSLKHGDTCPVCHIEKTVTGACWC